MTRQICPFFNLNFKTVALFLCLFLFLYVFILYITTSFRILITIQGFNNLDYLLTSVCQEENEGLRTVIAAQLASSNTLSMQPHLCGKG